MKTICPRGKMPLYCQYIDQFKPQGAYIQLNCENAVLSANYDHEVGGGVPVEVYYGQWRRYAIPYNVEGCSLKEFMEDDEVQALCERIIAGCDPGSGDYAEAELDEDAEEAEAELEKLISDTFDNYDSGISIMDFGDWFYDWDGGHVDEFTGDEKLAEITDKCVEDIEEESDVVIDGDVEYELSQMRWRKREELIEYLLKEERDEGSIVSYEQKKWGEGDTTPVYVVSKDGTAFRVEFNAEGNLVWGDKIMTRDEIYASE